MKDTIKKLIQDTLKKLDLESFKNSFDVVHPKNFDFGDYSTNLLIKMGPINKERDVIESLEKNLPKEIERIEEKVGFINFFLSKDFFTDSIKEILDKKENYGKNNLFKDQKIIIEYTDPNPFKEFHIGHLMSNSIGEAISRIIESGDSHIKRLSYGGDIGLHVAKTIWGKVQKPELSWGEAYVYGSQNYEENKEKIDELNKIIFDKSDSKINELYEEGREESISHFQKMFERLDTKFDKNIWESEVVVDALKAVALGLEKNILEKSEGAVVFRGENYDLHTRVFVNSKSIPTYEAKELGLGIKKYEEFSFDKSIIITGNEQDEYFKVVLKATELIKPEVSGKTVHIGHGMLRFASGKMSSRIGNVILAEDLIDQVKEKVFEKIVGRDFSDAEKEEISETVAIGAIKYSILRQAIGGDIIFDFDKSISFEGDSGPYLQYACVRAQSILKISNSQFSISKQFPIFNFQTPNTWETTELEKYLYRFEEVVERAGREYAPHYIVTYLTELAGTFNAFYANNKIIVEDDQTSPYKIALTQATAHILKSGLHLLGIKVSERM